MLSNRHIWKLDFRIFQTVEYCNKHQTTQNARDRFFGSFLILASFRAGRGNKRRRKMLFSIPDTKRFLKWNNKIQIHLFNHQNVNITRDWMKWGKRYYAIILLSSFWRRNRTLNISRLEPPIMLRFSNNRNK